MICNNFCEKHYFNNYKNENNYKVNRKKTVTK